MSKRPNILFLMSDEHRPDVTGYEGNKVIRTPVMDELARTGTVFRNAYTPAPICVPSRQCISAGQFPKTCHCDGFWKDLAPGYETMPRHFMRWAYNTVCAGKLHHTGPDQMQGWKVRIAPDAEVWDHEIPDRVPGEFERYKPAPGTGKWSNQRELEEARVADGPFQKFDRNALMTSLDYFERYFRDDLWKRPQAHRPLFFMLSLVQPHYPYFTTQELYDYYLPRVSIYREQPCDHPVLGQSQQNKPVIVSDETVRRVTAIYYGMIETVDTYYGRAMQTLRDLGQDLDDWIIIYTSDHGEMLGEHGIWEKTRFYEASVRVPLIIRWPKMFQGGRVVEENVNLCDLFATLCDLSGIEIPSGLDSRSMAPLLRGDASGWDNETISQFEDDHVMIKRDALKYQYYGEKVPEVLFDLKRDPGEMVNFAGDPAYAGAMEKFRVRLASLGYGPNACANYVNAGYGIPQKI